MNAVPESYISFLRNSSYLWGSSAATFKEYYLNSLNRTAISCYTIRHNFVLVWIPDASARSAYL